MEASNIEKIQSDLGSQLKEYVSIILTEYKDYIPTERQEYLNSIENFTSHIEIADTKTISCFCGKDNKIYFPHLAFPVIEILKEEPNYGINPDHKCFDQTNLIKNNNTFYDYINHAVISGLDAPRCF